MPTIRCWRHEFFGTPTNICLRRPSSQRNRIASARIPARSAHPQEDKAMRRLHDNRFIALLLLASFFATVAFGATVPEPVPQARYIRHANAVKSEFLVGLPEGTADSETLARTLGKQYRLEIIRVYKHALAGFHCRGKSANARRLAKDARVSFVEENTRFDLAGASQLQTQHHDPGAGWTLSRIAKRSAAAPDRAYFAAGT